MNPIPLHLPPLLIIPRFQIINNVRHMETHLDFPGGPDIYPELDPECLSTVSTISSFSTLPATSLLTSRSSPSLLSPSPPRHSGPPLIDLLSGRVDPDLCNSWEVLRLTQRGASS